MHHVVILKKSMNMMGNLRSGKKKIESRWYVNKVAPWNRIKIGDKVFFKNSGEKITLQANVKDVMQFDSLDECKIQDILTKYGEDICLSTKYEDSKEFYQNKNYCILIFIDNVTQVKVPFNIDKSGFGSACAWLIVQDIEQIKI